MIDTRLRLLVRERAADSCEYCQRKQVHSPLIRFHIEHIIPQKHGGTDFPENLALACAECNLRKSSDLAGLDPETGELTPLFHPRNDIWLEHFEWSELRLIGKTAIGRTTIRVLDINSAARLRIRMVMGI